MYSTGLHKTFYNVMRERNDFCHEVLTYHTDEFKFTIFGEKNKFKTLRVNRKDDKETHIVDIVYHGFESFTIPMSLSNPYEPLMTDNELQDLQKMLLTKPEQESE